MRLGIVSKKLETASWRAAGKPIWKAAHFFSVAALKQLVVQAAGKRLLAVRWRTTLWPIPHLTDAPLPWGGFIGLAAQLDEDT